MPDATTQRYMGDQGEQYHRLKREVPAPALPWVTRLRAGKFQADIRPTDTVLEYGVGYGWNLASLDCARKMGFDPSAFLAPELEKQGIEFIASTAALPDASADVIICHHVLEHLLSPAEALKEMHRLVKPAGRLLLVVPSEKSSRGDRYRPDDPNHHLYTWTVPLLANLVTDCGFQVEAARLAPYGYDRFAATRALRLHLGERGFRLIRKTLQILRPLREVRLRASRTKPDG